ncbi:MAG: C-terminal binding protein [Burkholderiaceae bacterium]|nr:C-terminal binding protein [Burkholderiaceae bacterium]MCX7902328.1 C-terminal binding protein [Burkholderiaceae bacterium]
MFREAGMEFVQAQCRTEQDVIDAAAGCDGLLVQYAPVNARVFAARPQIRIASRYGAGYDTINIDDARAYGVWVANAPDYGVGEVATHALAMALALLRHLPQFDRQVRAGRWHYTMTGPLPRVSDLTLGIIGFGRIGKRLAHLGRNVFARVIACDPYLIDGDFPPYVQRVDLETLCAQADVVSLHVPLTDETRGLINARTLSRMRRGAILVNTARGAVVDTDALLSALNAGALAAAALDVLPQEPPPAHHPLFAHPRVLLSPHAAFYSEAAEVELRCKAVQNLIDWARTGRPRYVVVEGRNQIGK